MRILITGGAGFIGSHLCELLLEEKHEIVVIDDLSTGCLGNISSLVDHIEFINAKVEDYKLNSLGKFDAVVHLAAQASVPLSIDDFYESTRSNLLSSIRIIDFCSSMELPLVYASSSAIYGGLAFGNDCSRDVDLVSPYAADKYALELYAEVANKVYNLSSIGLRLFNVYGPRQDPNNPYSGVISIFIKRILSHEPININGGYQTRDFIYVTDVSKVIYKALLNTSEKTVCETVNVLTGKSTSIDCLADILMSQIGHDVVREFKELPVGDPEQSGGNVDRLEKLLGVDLGDFTDLERGLTLTVDVMDERGSAL